MGEALDWIKTLNQGRHLSQSEDEKSDYRGKKKRKMFWIRMDVTVEIRADITSIDQFISAVMFERHLGVPITIFYYLPLKFARLS